MKLEKIVDCLETETQKFMRLEHQVKNSVVPQPVFVTNVEYESLHFGMLVCAEGQFSVLHFFPHLPGLWPFAQKSCTIILGGIQEEDLLKCFNEACEIYYKFLQRDWLPELDGTEVTFRLFWDHVDKRILPLRAIDRYVQLNMVEQ